MENEEFATFTAADNSDSQKLLINNGAINECTIRTAFGIDDSAKVKIYRMDGEVKYGVNSNKASGEIFWSLHKGWKDHQYIVDWTAPLSRHGTPMESIEKTSIGSKRKRMDDGLPMNTQEEDLIVTHCREYMLYFLLEQQSPGEFIEGSVRKCATIVSEKIALTAGHCIPEGISNNYPINLYDNSGKTYVVNALRVCKPGDQNDDYAILKIIEGNFAKIPNGLALPCDGERYFVLGYDAEYPHVSHLSCFSGRFQNTKIYANQSFVIGSPGTTDGCSGGGVFDQFGHLLGICVSGKLDWTNARQPSYSHIVPAHYCMAIAKEILK